MSKLVPTIKPASCVSWTFAFTRGGLNNSVTTCPDACWLKPLT
jgi:hypothetical protein